MKLQRKKELIMKKFLTLLVAVAAMFALLTGCGNIVYDDFESFMNNEMTDVNANYDKIKAEAGKWEELEDDAAIEASIRDTLLPLVNDSLDKLGKITPETDEVKEVKEKYVKVMEAYKDGFEGFLAGMQELDEEKLLAANESLELGLQLLEEYNASLEALAAELGAQIEY